MLILDSATARMFDRLVMPVACQFAPEIEVPSAQSSA